MAARARNPARAAASGVQPVLGAGRPTVGRARNGPAVQTSLEMALEETSPAGSPIVLDHSNIVRARISRTSGCMVLAADRDRGDVRPAGIDLDQAGERHALVACKPELYGLVAITVRCRLSLRNAVHGYVQQVTVETVES